MAQSDTPDLDEETVTTERVDDHAVELDVDGLSDGTVAIDYYDDQPRVIVRGAGVDVEDLTDDGETIVAVTPADDPTDSTEGA